MVSMALKEFLLHLLLPLLGHHLLELEYRFLILHLEKDPAISGGLKFLCQILLMSLIMGIMKLLLPGPTGLLMSN